MTCGDLVEIDVHRTLCGGAMGLRIPLDRVFAQPELFDIGDTGFLAPRLDHRALHAAYHAIVGGGPPPLRTLRDLAGYLTHPKLHD